MNFFVKNDFCHVNLAQVSKLFPIFAPVKNNIKSNHHDE